jgi:hypothetical protein
VLASENRVLPSLGADDRALKIRVAVGVTRNMKVLPRELCWLFHTLAGSPVDDAVAALNHASMIKPNIC